MKTLGEFREATKDLPDDALLVVDLWDEKSGDGEFHDIRGVDYNPDVGVAGGVSLMVMLPDMEA